MKSSEIKLSAPKYDVSLVLIAREPENWDDAVELCGGDANAALSAFRAGWIVKAQSKVRQAVEGAVDPESEGETLEGDALLKFAQSELDNFVYTGPRERKAKKKTKISKAALAEQGLKASDLKQMDKLLAALSEAGIEVVD